jgi:hypothetical protein
MSAFSESGGYHWPLATYKVAIEWAKSMIHYGIWGLALKIVNCMTAHGCA